MKNISKSVRLSQKVFNYINAFDGDGFNQKFENIILFAMEQEVAKRKRLEELDKLIDLRNKELSAINTNLYKARSESRIFLSILRELERVKLQYEY